MPAANKNKLLVEDLDTNGVVAHLMSKHIHWGNGPDEWPVEISIEGSATQILRGLGVYLKASNTAVLGLIIDADEGVGGRWDSICGTCEKLGVPKALLPDQCPPAGLILDQVGNMRFGCWIMPNNIHAGMVEHFCEALIDSGDPLISFAIESVSSAKTKGARFKDVHEKKAHIHTWLAWQDEPGQRMGQAIRGGLLDANAESARQFVDWFCNLYSLPRFTAAEDLKV